MATFHGHGEPRGFSTDGQYFAYCSSDGRLKVWEVATGVAKQEYVPSSHLSATCTCLSWAPSPQPVHRGAKDKEAVIKKKKKRKSGGLNNTDVDDKVEETSLSNDIIAMGTTAGTVLMYSVSKADLVSQLKGGHTDRINGLCWSHDGLQLFTCSDDKQIIQWNVLKGTIISKWKVDKGAVYSLLLLPDAKTLVAGGRSIQCWDVAKRKIVNNFVGHASEVWGLFAAPKHNQESPTYFLSSAIGDRSISAWRPEGSQSSNAVAAFALQDEPAFADLAVSATDDKPLVLAAVTQTGLLHIFEHQLNGKAKKPLEPKITVQIASENAEGSSKSAAKLLSILAAKPSEDGHVALVYGSLLRPSFERLDYRTCEPITSLLRKEHSFAPQQVSQAAAMKTRQPEVNADVKVLAPGLVTPGVAGASTDNRKRRINASVKKGRDELPMELRLADLSISKGGDVTVPPESGNLSHLLVQGLQSKDQTIVQSVLQRAEVSVIQGTIRRLPLHKVLPLLVEITRLMQGRTTVQHSYALWLRELLHRHCAFLATCDVQDTLTPLMSLMSARTALIPRLGQLQGRLDLLVGQFERRDGKETEEQDIPQEALLVYHEDPSDAESDAVEDALRNSTSESEDQWDEMSDLGVDNPEDGDEDDEDDENAVNGHSSEDSGEEEEDRMSVEGLDENGIDSDEGEEEDEDDEEEEEEEELQVTLPVKSAKVARQLRTSQPTLKAVKGGRKR